MWGIGVTSLIMVTSSPAVCRARMAASRPAPGPLTNTSTVFSPCSIAAWAAVSAAVWAAKGVDFREPRNPSSPELAQDRALPCVSVMVTMVLLNVDWICAAPRSMFLRSLRRRVVAPLRAVVLAAALLIPPAYFFLLAIVLRGPLRVRALVLDRWPRTGRLLR